MSRANRPLQFVFLALGAAVFLGALLFPGRAPQPNVAFGYLLMSAVLAAAVVRGLRGGLVAGLLASAVYVWIWALVFSAPKDSLLLPFQASIFLAVGALAGAAADQVGRYLGRMRDASLVDEATGLGSERYLRDRLLEELHRCRRYPGHFTLLTITFPQLARMRPARRNGFLRTANRAVRRRTVDICYRVDDRLFFLLPHTDWTSAGAFASRLVRELQESCVPARSLPAGQPILHLVSYPEGEAELLQFLGLTKEEFELDEFGPAAALGYFATVSAKPRVQ